MVLECSLPGCDFKTMDGSDAIVVALLTNHNLAHQLPPTSSTCAATCPKGPKLERPRIDMGVENETWNMFERRWDTFYRGSGIDAATASVQLFQCASDALGDALLKVHPTITTLPVDDVLNAMKSLAIIPVSLGVKRADFMVMHQNAEEQFRSFAARVRGKAETCEFRVSHKCVCGKDNLIDYTDEAIRDVLLSGIADVDIRREALSVEDMQCKSINEVTAFVEGKEMARNALTSSHNSAISSFKRDRRSADTNTGQKDRRHQPPPPPPAHVDRTRQAPCPDCGRKFHIFTENAHGWNRKPHTPQAVQRMLPGPTATSQRSSAQ